MPGSITCAEARQIDLVAYLETLGFAPQKVRGAEYWYVSPLRSERTASFKVDRLLNRWYDHGMGRGGSLIDFGLLYFNCTLRDLLNRLARGAPPAALFPPCPAPACRPAEGKIKVLSAGPFSRPFLRHYLHQRGIEEALAERYCREVCFSLYGREHRAIGFLNQSGGYELRNPYFKGSASPKDLTLVDHQSPAVRVFEGFFSFLSFVQLRGEKEAARTNFVVLNSLALLHRATPLLEQHHRIQLYLDRDDAGRNATREALSRSVVYVDKSALYRGYKDLNDLLVQRIQRPVANLRRGRSL